MGEVIYSGESKVRLSFVYKETLDAEQFNQQWANTLKSGVYSYTSPFFTRVSDSSITVEKFTVVVKNDDISYTDSLTASSRTADIAVKVTTKSSQTLTGISDSSPYIVAELWSDLTGVDPSDQNQYQQDEDLSLRIRNIAYDDYDSSKQILLGKCLYRDNAGIRDELYDFDITNSMQKAPLLETETWFDEFIGNVTGGLQVTINGGTLQGVSVDDLILTYNGGGSNPSLPANGYHRYDLVHVNDANTLTYVSGTEEVNPDDGETRPTQVSLSNYSFPICHIYVSGDLTGISPYIIEPVDVINIMPRFMRKAIGATAPLPDRLITTQTEFTDYFGTNDGNTYTITDSEHNVYLKARNDGLPYELDHLVEINDDDVRIECLNGAKIKFTAKEAGIKIKDDTHLIIDEYNKNTFEVLSENTYDDDGDQVVLESGDEIFAFSDTPEINRKYTISDIVKSMKEDVRLDVNSSPNWFYNSIIDNVGNIYDKIAIAKDSNNNIFVVYEYNVTIVCAVSTDNGLSWTSTDIRSGPPPSKHFSIAVDSNDHIYVSYRDRGNEDLEIAISTDRGASWSTSEVETTGSVGVYNAIAIDSKDNIYIAHQRSTDISLRVSVSSDQGTSWSNIEIDNVGNVGGYVSIDIDNFDNIIIAYYDYTNNNLKYAISDDNGTSWTTGDIDDDSNIIGQYTSIIVDSENNYHVSYYDLDDDNLKYAISKDNGSSWSTSVIDSTGNVGQHTSIAVDDKDKIYISYYDVTNTNLKYAISDDNGSTWVIKDVTTTEDMGKYSAIMIDNYNNIFIAYKDETNNYLKIAKGSYNNSGILTSSDTNIATNLFHCVAFENSGTNYLFVAYEESINKISYNVYKYDSTSKQYEVYAISNNEVDSGLSTVSYIRCAQDGTNIHVVYEDGSGLYHNYESISNILSDSDFDSNNTFTFENSSDYSSPVIFTNTDREVYLAYLDDSISPYRLIFKKSTTTPATGTAYSFASRVTFDSSPTTDLDNNAQHSIVEYGGTVIISFGEDDSGNTNLYCVYSTDDGSSWAKTSLDITDNCGFSSKLALNPSGIGFADIAIVYDNKNTEDKDTVTFAEVDISGTPSLDNKTDVISETGASFDYIDLIMSDNNQYPLSSDILAQVVGFNNNIVNDTVILSTDDVGKYNAMVIDSEDNIYIAYYDETNNDLEIAISIDDGDSWSTKTIDTIGSVGTHISITVDSKDNVLIAYKNSTRTVLKFAQSNDNGSTWKVKEITSFGVPAENTSIIVDSNDYIYISYEVFLGEDFFLGFAKSTDNGDTWETLCIDIIDDLEHHSSITADSNDCLYVAYYDSSNNKLKFAKSVDLGSSWIISEIDDTTNAGKYTSIITDNNDNIYISYQIRGVNGPLNLAKSCDGGNTWTISQVDTTVAGESTSILFDRDENLYISYYDDTNDALKLAKSTNLGATWIVNTLLGSVGDDIGEYSSLAMNSQNNLFVSYYNTDDGDLGCVKLLKSIYSAVSIDEGTNWATRGIYLQENDNQGFLADVFNDYCYLVYYNGDTETGFFEDTNHLLKLFYNFEITVSEDIYPVNNANIIISENFVENIDLKLTIDADSYGDETDAKKAVIDMSNSVNSNLQTVIENSNHSEGITGDSNFNISKVYNLTMKDILIDDTNSIAKNIAKISHSTLSSINILKQDGKKNFSDCKNISVIGMIDKKATIGNGDFNE